MAKAKTSQPSLLSLDAELPVHPLAAVFPMMGDDELAELAEDIKANGQIHPIMLDAEGAIVDGRNRFKACQLAAVEPKFARLDGEDPAAYIVSANLNRRNLTKGQQAMALAMIYPEPAKGGRGKKSEVGNLLVSSGFSRQRLDQARAVLGHSRTLAEAVLAGTTTLDKALALVEDEKALNRSAERLMAELQAEAPDLADLVAEERMNLDEAIAALRERRQKRRWAIDAAQKRANELRDSRTHATTIASVYADTGERGIVTQELLDSLADSLAALQRVFDQYEKGG